MTHCLREVRIEQDKELKSKISEQLEALRTAALVVEFGINSYQTEESLCLYTTTIKWLFEAYAKTNNEKN